MQNQGFRGRISEAPRHGKQGPRSPRFWRRHPEHPFLSFENTSQARGEPVSTKSIEVDQYCFHDEAKFVRFDGTTIPFPDASLDIVLAAWVFHQIDHDEHVALLVELRRVLSSGGMFFVFERNPYNPLTVKTVRDCSFNENARLISGSDMCGRISEAGLSEARIRDRIFFPRALRALRLLEKKMTWLPLGAPYYALGVK